MLIPKEISTPLRTITLMIDDSKPMTDKDNRLVEMLVELHNKQYELGNIRKLLQEYFDKHHIEFLDVLKDFEVLDKKMHELPVLCNQLLPKQINYKTYKNGVDNLIQVAVDYNTLYFKFDARLKPLSQGVEVMGDMRDKFAKIEEQTIEIENSISKVLYKDYQKIHEFCIDIASFRDEKSIFSEIQEGELEIYNPLEESIDDYIVNEYNPMMNKFNQNNKDIQVAGNIIQKLHKNHILYTKAKEFDFCELWLEWEKQAHFQEEIEGVDFGISYDVEFGKKGGIIFHLYTNMVTEGIFNLFLVSSFRLSCSLKEIFTPEMMYPLVGRALFLMKNQVELSNNNRTNKLNMSLIDIGWDVVEGISNVFLEGETAKEEFLTESKNMYAPALNITKSGLIELLGVTMVNIMEQLLFTNPNFDHIRNQSALNEIVGINQFVTLKHRMMKLAKEETILNNRQHVLFLLLLDCTCQLLLGDNGEEFYDGLDGVKINAQSRLLFLKEAQKFYAQAMKNYKENGSKIPFLEKTRDWNRVFF